MEVNFFDLNGIRNPEEWIDNYIYGEELKISFIKPCARGKSEDVLFYCDPQSNQNNIRFILILQGRLDITVDYVKHTFEQDSIVELNPSLMINNFVISPDFSCYTLNASRPFLNDTLLDRRPIPMKHFRALSKRPGINISINDTLNLKNSIKRIIHFIDIKEHIFKKELIHNTFYNYILEFANIILSSYNATEAESEPLSRKDQIIMDFMKLVNEHGKKEHSPSFYADKLCISVQYLSLILKERSTNTTADWIATYLVIQAKSLLRTSKLSIQGISDELYFSDQASFGKFFKKHTGVSPKKYKQENAFL